MKFVKSFREQLITSMLAIACICEEDRVEHFVQESLGAHSDSIWSRFGISFPPPWGGRSQYCCQAAQFDTSDRFPSLVPSSRNILNISFLPCGESLFRYPTVQYYNSLQVFRWSRQCRKMPKTLFRSWRFSGSAKFQVPQYLNHSFPALCRGVQIFSLSANVFDDAFDCSSSM